MNANPLAGKTAPLSALVDVPRLITAYFSVVPDPSLPGAGVFAFHSGILRLPVSPDCHA